MDQRRLLRLRAPSARLPAGDNSVLEREPLEQLARDGELAAYRHEGFWEPMDTQRDLDDLNRRWSEGSAPWKVWDA